MVGRGTKAKLGLSVIREMGSNLVPLTQSSQVLLSTTQSSYRAHKFVSDRHVKYWQLGLL